jgi:hypothetical protein
MPEGWPSPAAFVAVDCVLLELLDIGSSLNGWCFLAAARLCMIIAPPPFGLLSQAQV